MSICTDCLKGKKAPCLLREVCRFTAATSPEKSGYMPNAYEIPDANPLYMEQYIGNTTGWVSVYNPNPDPRLKGGYWWMWLGREDYSYSLNSAYIPEERLDWIQRVRTYRKSGYWINPKKPDEEKYLPAPRKLYTRYLILCIAITTRCHIAPAVDFLPAAPREPLEDITPPLASCAGSALFLQSKEFLRLVAAGQCPIKLCLAVYHWPVRSALLLVLTRVCQSPKALAAVDKDILDDFTRAALAALGYSVSGRYRRADQQNLLSFLDHFPANVPVPVISGRVSAVALASAFSALARSLHWLSNRSAVAGCACPPALRGSLARLVKIVKGI